MTKKVKKAGCILVNPNDKTIALVYRDKRNDYSFPKGHMEDGETLIDCAIRETAEETKRIANIIDEEPIFIERYITPDKSEDVELYYFLAIDGGKSDNTSWDTHDTLWVKYNDVYDKLTYNTQKELWNKIKGKVKNIGDDTSGKKK